ncbi:dihydrolipoamide acetyltransferase family protein [Aliikangiella sp. G2MR2-5]|uniref:dihydrolipoamide acetyltransferase family protein n=1 Tax=Aliikangiella sp. G2MR2-5 TaxID=2788943 RepID=UPI0018A92DCB|nr:2-oxo acid dehydrogenase subunit E2 [Aliikangiella sp. G2MR2-5]
MSNLIDIVLPEGQLEGTSATLSAWLVKEGDSVKKGDPLAELETDKVVMEVCADANGVISKLTANLGDDVAPEQVLGQLAIGEVNAVVTSGVGASAEKMVEMSATTETAEVSTTELSGDESARAFISPAVRRLLRENDLTIEPIPGTGKRGRVTRDDVINYLKDPKPRTIETAQEAAPVKSPSPLASIDRQSRPLKGEMVAHSQMRKSIASHMVESLLETSPHVTSVFEMDMTNIMEHRKWHKKEYEELGVKLTFTSYFLAAMAKAVKEVPQTNARFHADALEIFTDVNIGVGTALGDAGLVVPVIEQVQEMNLFEISKRLGEMTTKARNGKLTANDMKNGTITISNHGVSGSLFATPIIINQPQVAILGVGKLEKRVVVEEVNGVDTMVIRPKCYVSLSIDHRALDAHQTNLFLSHFVNVIENWGQ